MTNPRLSRMAIRREAANPLMLPSTPRLSDAGKTVFGRARGEWDRVETEWESWRQKAQHTLEQAIMALKLDPTQFSEIQKTLQEQIDKLKLALAQVKPSDFTEVNTKIVTINQTIEQILYDLSQLQTATSYQHTQNLPASTWTIHHNLGRYPGIEILDDTNEVVEGRVVHSDRSTAVAQFNFAATGKALCT